MKPGGLLGVGLCLMFSVAVSARGFTFLSVFAFDSPVVLGFLFHRQSLCLWWEVLGRGSVL